MQLINHVLLEKTANGKFYAGDDQIGVTSNAYAFVLCEYNPEKKEIHLLSANRKLYDYKTNTFIDENNAIRVIVNAVDEDDISAEIIVYYDVHELSKSTTNSQKTILYLALMQYVIDDDEIKIITPILGPEYTSLYNSLELFTTYHFQ